MNEIQKSYHTLDSSSLDKIKPIIDGFVKIESNIDRIVNCFSGKGEELKHIKDKVEQLNSLKLDLLKLQFSIYNDIGFAKTIEKIRGNFESLKKEAEKFKKVENYIGYLIANIESIIQTVRSICYIIESIRYRQSGLSNLNNLKSNIIELRLYLERLSQCIKVTNRHLSVLNHNLSEMKEYMGKLSRIKTKIMVLSFEVMALPFIESFPDLLFIPLGLRYKKRTHEFFKKIHESIKSILNTIELCRSVLGITILDTRITKIVVSYFVGEINEKSEGINGDIQKVECSIESVIICFLKCSNKFITQNTIELRKRMLTSGDQLYNNELAKSGIYSQHRQKQDENGNAWTLLSNMCIVESKFVATNLYESITMTDEMLKKLYWIENCQCIEYSSPGECGLDFMRYIKKKFEYTEHRKHSKCVINNQGNHLCICLVINYVLYPTLLQCLCYLIDMDFDTLSTVSREFDKYNIDSRYRLDTSRFLVFVVGVCMKISDFVYERYAPVLAPCRFGDSICFCGCYNDSYYKYFISTILYLCFLVENMFSIDESIIHHLVQGMSSVYDQIYHDVSYYKRPKTLRPRNESCICLCSSEHKCDCGQVNNNSLCDVCKNCKIVCLSICSLCCMMKSFGTDGKCDVIKPCEGQTGDKCCICSDSGQASSCVEAISRLSNLCTNTCTGSLNSADCKEICECIKKLSGQIEGLKSKFKGCFGDFVKKLCCSEVSPGKSPSKCVDCSISRVCTSCSYHSNKLISAMLYHGWVIGYAAIWTEVFGKLHSDISYAIKDVLEPSKNNIILTRGNKIYDSTTGLINNKLEGVSNNNYSYNDAYRINKSRAHGSLKYIIIKIVLILIIVVMTIFIRVKIETDDDYKIDGQFGEENGMCECDTGNNNNKEQSGHGIDSNNKHFQIALKNSRKSVEKSDVQLYESFKNKHME